MTSKQRLTCAIAGGQPDRLPATTHHLMDSFLKHFMGGASKLEFFDRFGLDAIDWVVAHRPDVSAGEFYDPLQGPPGFLEARRIATRDWQAVAEDLPGREEEGGPHKEGRQDDRSCLRGCHEVPWCHGVTRNRV